jgi:hypothetical protein
MNSETDHILNVLSAIGSIGQAVTAIVALAIVVITARAAHRFNEGQALALHVQNMNHFNDRMVDLAIADRRSANLVGRQVIPDSDILCDYMHFILLNSVHVAYAMNARSILKDGEVERLFANAANFLRRHGEDYVNALLSRGYDPGFVGHLKLAIQKSGGYPAREQAPGPEAGLPA